MTGKVKWTILLVASPFLVLLAMGLIWGSNGFTGIQAVVVWALVALGLLWVWVVNPHRRQRT